MDFERAAEKQKTKEEKANTRETLRENKFNERMERKNEKLREKDQKKRARAEARAFKRERRDSDNINYASLGSTKEWDTLDNTAHLFPIIAGETMTNVYRMSFVLKEDVEPDALQLAVEEILPYFGTFHSTLKKGLFWYYFENNKKRFPPILIENDIPCRYFAPNSNKNYLFRISYYKKKINLEVFHVLADGVGGINFFRELLYHYLRRVHPELAATGTGLSSETSLNTEDSYNKNYKHYTFKGYNSPNSLIISGEKLENNHMGIMHGKMLIDDVKAVTKRYGVTINEYLVTVFAYSIYKEYFDVNNPKPITIAVPVDLRPYYNSNTTKNFFVMTRARFEAKDENHSFEEFLDVFKTSLRAQRKKETLEQIFSFSVGNERIMILRSIPLVLKSLGIKFYYERTVKKNTSTVTNIGKITLKPEYEQYVEDFNSFISKSYCQDIKGLISSFRDRITFTITSALKDTYIQKTFFRKLSEDGIDVTIETNGVYYG